MSADWSYGRSLRTTAVLCLGPAVGVGVARFAYGLLLPSMRTQLHWSYAFAGSMNTANALGYLVGAAAAATSMRRSGARAAFLVSMGVAVVATAASAASGNPVVLLLTRLLAGVGGAVNFTAGAGLVATATTEHAPRRANAMLGLYFAGVGGGIVASGVGVPVVLAATPAHEAWRWGWLLLGILGVAAFVVAVPGTLACREPPVAPPHDKTWPWRGFIPLLSSYFLFGAGYIAYMTFIVAYLNQHGTGHALISAFWAVLGIAALLGTVAWQPAVRLRGGRSVAAALAVTCVGALIPLISAGPFAVVVSAVLFGGSFLAVVTTVTAVARKALPPHHWAASIAALTTAFALGQCLGPIFAGVLADRPGGLALGLTLSTGVLALGVVVALRQQAAIAGAG